MLIGETTNHQQVNLLKHSREEIEQLRKKQWYCRSCGQSLVLKNGLVKEAHFAHRANTACNAFSEGESAEHLSGKELLATWCRKNQVSYELEAYLVGLKQRPDLLLAGKVAIEFQCSSLPLKRLVERTRNYQQHGYQVIWLLGEKFFLGKTLGGLQRSCISYHQKIGCYFWELDVTKRELRCQYHIEETLGKKSLHYFSKYFPLGEASILACLNFPKQDRLFAKRYFDGRQLLLDSIQYYERALMQRDRTVLKLQERLYYQGTHLGELPIEYFLPLTQPLLAKDSVLVWRLLFWQALGEVPYQTLNQLAARFEAKLTEAQLAFYAMPLIDYRQVVQRFVSEYLCLLMDYEFLQLVDNRINVLKYPKGFANSQVRERLINNELENYRLISVIPHQDML